MEEEEEEEEVEEKEVEINIDGYILFGLNEKAPNY